MTVYTVLISSISSGLAPAGQVSPFFSSCGDPWVPGGSEKAGLSPYPFGCEGVSALALGSTCAAQVHRAPPSTGPVL